MAVNLTTPRGEGYAACLKGQLLDVNPYGIDSIPKWAEWINGWYEAWHAGLFAKFG